MRGSAGSLRFHVELRRRSRHRSIRSRDCGCPCEREARRRQLGPVLNSRNPLLCGWHVDRDPSTMPHLRANSEPAGVAEECFQAFPRVGQTYAFDIFARISHAAAVIFHNEQQLISDDRCRDSNKTAIRSFSNPMSNCILNNRLEDEGWHLSPLSASIDRPLYSQTVREPYFLDCQILFQEFKFG